jgi:hypothetical protein
VFIGSSGGGNTQENLTDWDSVILNLEDGEGEFHLGQTATEAELDDAIVRYHEGVETVFQRQIKKNPILLTRFGYKNGDDLETFAWDLADQLAKTFGYINAQRKEIRVSKPDVTAYRLRLEGNKLKVYEYNNFKIVNIQDTTSTFKDKRSFEYYYIKK